MRSPICDPIRNLSTNGTETRLLAIELKVVKDKIETQMKASLNANSIPLTQTTKTIGSSDIYQWEI